MISTRPCILEIDLDALTHNLKFFQDVSGQEIFAVVKANAYGHGAVPVAKHLEQQGVKVLCVSSLDEAVHLYEAGVRTDLLIFGPTDPHAIKLYHQSNFIYTLSSWDVYQKLPDDLPPSRFHIKVNSGMNRLGFKDISLVQQVLKNTKHQFEGIYTHFSSADEASDYTPQQINLFKEFVSKLDFPFKWIHAGNSHGALLSQPDFFNASRIGIGLYGIVNSALFPKQASTLKQVMTLKARIIHIDTLKKGEYVGYNHTYTAENDMIFGTLLVGYADGLSPFNTRLPLKKGDSDRPILGRICMDQTMLALDQSDQIGDWIEIIGPQRRIVDIALACETIPHVVMAQLSHRLPRVFLKGA